MSNLIKSISYDETEIIQNILKLHCKGGIELDPTYSKGNFYKSGGIEHPEYVYDIAPQFIYVRQANAENIPIESNSINTIMFDPPFLATKGKSLKINNDSNKIAKRFSVYPDEKSLHTFYVKALKEFYRLLKKDGILIFKCQDKVSSGKNYFSHTFVQNQAEKIGFYTKDLFILTVRNRIVADWQKKNQKHARKYHCYFWVFQKCNRKIQYI